VDILGWLIIIGGLIALILYEIWVTKVTRRAKGKNPSQTISMFQWGNGIIIGLLLAGGFYLFGKMDRIIDILTSIKVLLSE